MLKKKDANHSNWIYYLIIFIVIFVSDDTFNFGTNEDSFYLGLKYLIYFLLTLFLLLNSKLSLYFRLTQSNLALYSFIFIILLTMVFNFDLSGGYIYQIWLFFLGFLLVNFYSPKKIIEFYLNFLYFLSLISLIVFFIANFSLSLFEFFPIQYNSAGATMYNLGVCIVFADGAFIRNTSIFREPGVFMTYLSIAIMFELFFKEEINKRNLFVFILTIFTTFSTTAFITLSIIFLAYLFTKNKNKIHFETKKMIITTIFVVIAVLLLSSDINSKVFDKISGDNLSEGSSLARSISVLANFNIFLDHFLFGIGIKNYSTLFERYTRDLIGVSLDLGNNTNTITTVLAIYGLFFGCLFMYLLISFAKKTSNSIIVRSLIFLVLVMLYSNEDLRYSLMSSCLLMFGLVSRKQIGNNL